MSDPSEPEVPEEAPGDACPPSLADGPCQPYADASKTPACPCDGLDLNLEPDRILWERMIDHATRRLFRATDGRFRGCCTATIRPMGRRCSPGLGRAWASDLSIERSWWPSLPMLAGFEDNGMPLFVNCWADTCDGSRLETIRLPWLPVRDVLEVKVNGEPLDESAYRLLPGTNVLARVDGQPWPTQQNQALEDTEVGTWSVTFRHGMDLPSDAQDLVTGFACELAKRCRNVACSLPDGLKVLSRPGITYAVVDPLEYRSKGLTGYLPLDDWIMELRGNHARERPRLFTMFDQPTAMRG